MMKGRKVSEILQVYLDKVLDRDSVPHYFLDGRMYTELPSRKFAVYIEDAICEMERDATYSKAPVYSFRTLCNTEKLQRLKGINNNDVFHILKSDTEKFRQYAGI